MGLMGTTGLMGLLGTTGAMDGGSGLALLAGPLDLGAGDGLLPPLEPPFSSGPSSSGLVLVWTSSGCLPLDGSARRRFLGTSLMIWPGVSWISGGSLRLTSLALSAPEGHGAPSLAQTASR